MSEEMVRVHTGKDEYVTVPISQVPPGYIRVHIRDHGECYMDPSALTPPREYRHPPFSDETRVEVQKQYDAIAGAGIKHATRQTLDEWVDGFRYDATPWRELATWDLITAAIRKFTSHLPGSDELSVSKREDVYSVLMAVVNSEPGVRPGAKFQALGSLIGKRVGEIVNWMHSDEATAIKREALKKYRVLLRDRIREVYPDRVNLHALIDEEGKGPNPDATFDPVEFIATADIIMGEDVITPSKRFVVYGKERYAQLLASAVGDEVNVTGVRIVWVEIDVDTDEYDKLIEVVTAIKGRDNYHLVLPDNEPPSA